MRSTEIMHFLAMEAQWESHAVSFMHSVNGNHLIDSSRMNFSHKRYTRYSNSIPDD